MQWTNGTGKSPAVVPAKPWTGGSTCGRIGPLAPSRTGESDPTGPDPGRGAGSKSLLAGPLADTEQAVRERAALDSVGARRLSRGTRPLPSRTAIPQDARMHASIRAISAGH